LKYAVLNNQVPTISDEGSSALVFNEPDNFVYKNAIENLVVRRRVRESRSTYGRSKRPLGPEAILHKAWRNAGLEKAKVRGRDGQLYSIIYGGKPGGSLGPDFTDAVVRRDDGVVFRGDIEIHVRESDWRAHGHHTDPRYNGVVLHVVAADSNGVPALKATGSTIPLLALNWKRPDGNSKPSKRASKGLTDSPFETTPEASKNIKLQLDLNSAGIERFHSQAAGIALDIEAFGADQALWLGVLGALGYPRNKRTFRVIGTNATWSMISECRHSDEVEALLLEASGLERSTSEISSKRILPKMNAPKWVRPFGRPANSPQARIRAVSVLTTRRSKSGGIASFAMNMIQTVESPKQLQSMFRPDDLLADKEITVLGAARSSEIVVNVLLPAAFALLTQRPEKLPESTYLKNKILSLYKSHPKLAENSVTKEASIALSVDHVVPKISTACDQQGLISLYREMFRNGIHPRQPRLPGV